MNEKEFDQREKALLEQLGSLRMERDRKAGRGKTVSDMKGVSDLKTGITAHLRSKPRTEGEEYLQLYLAGKEKARLGRMARTWEKMAIRTQERRSMVKEDITKLEKRVGLERPADVAPRTEPIVGDGQKPAPNYTRRQWKTMPLDY